MIEIVTGHWVFVFKGSIPRVIARVRPFPENPNAELKGTTPRGNEG